jgi:hypothetical protein
MVFLDLNFPKDTRLRRRNRSPYIVDMGAIVLIVVFLHTAW